MSKGEALGECVRYCRVYKAVTQVVYGVELIMTADSLSLLFGSKQEEGEVEVRSRMIDV